MFDKKGQTGLEIMAFFAFALLIFSITYILITSKVTSAWNSEASQYALQIAERVASELNAAVSEGDGYSKSFNLPDSIRGAGYNISVEKGLVFVDWSDNGAASYTIAENVTGNFTYGWNLIQNKEGVIFVNKTVA